MAHMRILKTIDTVGRSHSRLWGNDLLLHGKLVCMLLGLSNWLI